MKTDLTHILFVLDESGSMGIRREETIAGFNALVRAQCEAPGECALSLWRFSSNVTPGELQNVDLLPELDQQTYKTDGYTALNDAVCMAIDAHGAHLAALPESDRPGLVAVVILTDGMENASTRFSRNDVKDRIKHQSEVYGWKFQFLGVGEEAFEQAADLEIKTNSSLRGGQAAGDAVELMRSASSSLTRGREARAGGQSLEAAEAAMAYTDEERKAAVESENASGR